VPCTSRAAAAPGCRWLIAAQAGDAEALDSLLSSYLPLIYNIVGRGLGGHADVDDVVQKTMLRAVRGLGDLRDPAAFRSWLVAVAIQRWPSPGRPGITPGPPRPREASSARQAFVSCL